MADLTGSPTETPATYPPPPKGEAHWPPLVMMIVTIILEVLLPDRLAEGSKWILPGLEVVILVALVVASPMVVEAPHSTRRMLTLTLTAVVAVANGISLVLLAHLLLQGDVTKGRELIIAGTLIWLTNVALFSLWYWEFDRGGPGNRAAAIDGPPDFLFPQMTVVSEPAAGVSPAWRPKFVDYLYLSLTNAAAFSPTDTMPLSASAKLTMGAQSLVSLVTIGLVVSRAVNIL